MKNQFKNFTTKNQLNKKEDSNARNGDRRGVRCTENK